MPPFPAYVPPTPRAARRNLTPLYILIAAVAVLGGVLAVAIVRYQGGVVGTAAPTTTTTTTTETPDTGAILPGPPETSSPEWTTTTTTPPPAEYRTVTGPEGVYVSIPADWTVHEGAVPSNLQADSPNGQGLIRFGGSASTPTPLYDTVASNETDNPNITNGYQRIELTSVPSLPVEAVDWEFTFVKDGATRHSYGRYWRTNGIDYVVYASTSADLWYAMTDIIDVMVRTAGPI
jgi:hypothetical protein